MMKIPKLLASGAIALASVVVATPPSAPAAAAGTPDVVLTKTMPDEVLYGAPGAGGPVANATVIPVTLTLENPTTDDGFNASFNDTLPAGVSYVPGSASPEPTVLAQGDGTTVLIWRNVADSLAGTTVTIDYEIAADTTAYDLLSVDTVSNSANAYVNANARFVPTFDPVTGQILPITATGNDAATAQTTIIPFELTKIQRDTEGELLRGVHDHQTVYTLRIDNNFVNPTTNFEIVDYIPATMEFLGCGTVDNTTTPTPGDEYPSSGPINPGNAPALANPCPTPSAVETVTEDPDGVGGLPDAVYTKVTWDVASLATDLAAGGFVEFDYVAAIPLRENVDDGSTADPTANLDNNTGPLTTEVASGAFPEGENEAENYAEATGDYNGSVSSTDDDTAIVSIEDVSIHKAGPDTQFVQGDTPTFTLTIESSEYTTATGPITVTDTIPAALNLTSSTPVATSGPVLNADGSHTYTWVRPAFAGPSSTDVITLNTQVREFYRDGTTGLDSTEPVSANQSYTNVTDLITDATIITDNDGTTTTQSVVDESAASQSSAGPTILKEVSNPVAGTMTCGDGSAPLPTYDPAFASSYRPGDRVCFRLNVDFPANLDTNDTVIQDFLPAGFAYESFEYGSAHNIPTAGIVFTPPSPADAPLMSWTLPDTVDQGTTFQVVIATIVSDPLAAAAGDILDNLQKLRYTDGGIDGELSVFQLRDQALAEWSEPSVAISKGVITVNTVAVPGAPADGVTVERNDVVRYQIDLVNDGSEPALDVSVRDLLPTGITCNEVTNISGGGACDLANGWIQWDPADDIDLAAGGGTAALVYDVTIPATITPDASLVNTAGVRQFTGDTNTGTPFTYVPGNNIDPTLQPSENTDPADDSSEVVTAEPTIAKTRATTIVDGAAGNGNNQATVGETIEYTVTVTLPDNLTYTNASITDVVDAEKDLDVTSVAATLDGAALPTGFSLTASDPLNSITLDLPDPYTVPDGADQVIVIEFDAVVLDIPANVRTTGTPNTANFTFEDTAGATRSLSASVGTQIVEPNIVLDKSNGAVGPVSAGQAVDYVLTVTNDNTSPRVSAGYDTLVVDTVPEDLIVLDAPGGNPVADAGTVGPDGGVWNAGARTITWSVGTVLPGQAITLGYQVQVDDPLIAAGVLTNTANATTTSLPGVVAGERTSTSAQGGPGSGYQDPAQSSVSVPVFSLTKDATPAIVTIGETVSYEIDVTIPGGVIAFDTAVLDQIPPGIVFEALTAVTCAQGAGACTPAVGTSDVSVIPASGAASGDDIVFYFDDVFDTASSAERVVTIVYTGYVADTADADSGATLTNTAAVYWNSSDTIPAVPTTTPVPADFASSSPSDDASVDTVEPTLVIDKNVDGEDPTADDTRRAKPGDVLTYTLEVTNNGTSPAYDATVSDVAIDDSWAFVDTTAAPGVTNTDADPAGGLEWTIDGPIAVNATVTISYTLTVPATFDETAEVPGFEQINTADVPSYFGVDDRTVNPTRYREYDDVTPDTVSIELDLASIGDYIWFDVNDDGLQGDPADEPPLGGVPVTVTFFGPDDAPGGGDDEVYPTITQPDGSYLIENLPGGQYRVDVDDTALVAAGFEPSYDLDGTTVTPDGLWTGPLGEDEAKRDVDFGYTGTGSIGDTLWFDQNLDGVKNVDEAGLGGIEIQVTWYGPDDDPAGTDNVVYITTTAADGTYLVENLPAGGYDVVVTGTLPAGYTNVFDPDGGTLNQSSLVLGAGADDLDQDFGYAGVGSIGDTIYLDQNGNSTQDPGEPGLVGVMVQLISFGPDGVLGGSDDSTFMTTTTTDGAYLFDNLPPGDFQVDVLGGLPANVTNTGDPGGPTVGDSSSLSTLTQAEPNDLDQDFGYDANSVLGDRVWWDLDRDGVQDMGEPGLNGVQITATGPNGLVLTTTTSGDGDYLFVDIPDGAWTVTVGPGVPPGFDQTYDASGSQTDGESTTNLATEDLLQDFGYAGNSSIGDRLWLDRNQDGVQDPGEPGIELVDVELTWFGPDGVFGGGDDVVFVDETGADGEYGFDGLPAGEYSVRVIDTDPDFPVGVAITYDRDGGIAAPDGVTPVTLGANEDIDDVDFGFAGGGAIGDTVWFDRNDNGVLDGDEVGLSGVEVTVTWLGEDDAPGGGDDETFVVTTGTDGTYLVDGLPSGVFDVTVTAGVPVDMVPTFDADGGFDETSRVTLGLNEVDLDQDFGYRGTGLIGDTVYLDLDGDGTQGLDEPGVPGQTVELTWPGPSGPETFTTTTGPDGSYVFDNLPPAVYVVTVVGGIVALAENVTDPDGGGDSTSAVPLANGEENRDQDFGYRGNNAIGDTVWHDVNADGVDDAAEPRLEGVEVTVVWFGPDGVAGGVDDVTLPPTTTNVDGNYLVGNLPDGSYSVTVTDGLPSGLDANTFDGDDGATNPDGTSVVTDLGVGTTDPIVDLDQDFGYTGTGTIGDTIWLDLDGDGVLDAGEPGIPAATVTLLGAGADGVLDTADDVDYGSQTTGSDGTYLFENLPAGPFRVTVADLPAGVSNTADPDGGSDDTSETSLPAGGDDLDQDFGYNGSASVGDTIWLDVDGDGMQDPNEPGVAGVTVTVVSPGLDGVPGTADDIIVETETDANGQYLVEGLPPGTTVVSYDPGDLGAGLVPDSDLDGGDLTTATVTLANGDDVRDVDFGVVGGASLTGSVFIDLDTDGVRDPSEDGIPGVTVEITWDGPDGPVVLTVVTDADGRWSLDDIPAGDYTVTVLDDTVPDGLVATTPNDVTVTVPPGGTNNVDNGYVPTGSIGDRVWFDLDNDGVQDPGEPGVGAVTVRLLDENGTVIATRVTDGDGIYVFADLPPGVYRVVVDPTTLPEGTTIVFDRDGNPNGRTTVTLGPGDDIDDADVGITNTADLPATGGNGVARVLVTGFALLIAGVALLLIRRRRNDLRVTVS